ncbi:MAG: histidine phosphatase family protein [Bacteroidales bacterium]|nr:histidine phosphatase family protein [Bacteroidales bacterium]
MKNIILLRHAKAEKENYNLSDFDRKLNEKGIKQVTDLKETFFDDTPTPDLILISSAQRTKETYNLLFESKNYKAISTYKPDLYLASVDVIESIVASLPDSVQTLLLIGHNNGISDFANKFGLYIGLPTCGVVVINSPLENWTDISNTKGTITYKSF